MEEQEVPTKDYKYKVRLAKDIIEGKRIYGDTNRRNMEVQRKNKRGIYKPTLNVREKDLKVTRKTASEYGEFIASKIANKVGIAACEVELVKKKVINKYSKSGKYEEIPGCISYLDLKNGESLVPAIDILFWYKTDHRKEFSKIVNPAGIYKADDPKVDPCNDINSNNIEVIIPAFEAYIKEKCNGTQEQADEIRQNIIDMVTFDCFYGNTDRNDENYALAIDANDNARFYPLYDNEYILGFSEIEDNIQKYSAPRLQEHISKDLYSRMGVSSQPMRISPTAMMTYLFTTYPEETRRSYDKVVKFKENDLLKLMSECEGLSAIHKAYALRIFRLRRREIECIKDEYFDKEGNMKPHDSLPRNKPMEMARARTGYKRKSPSLEDN